METIPRLFEERVHNLEFYAQKRIYQSLKLLNRLPMNQNVAGEFTNYIGAKPEDVIGDVISTGDGLDFNEIAFGEPSKVMLRVPVTLAPKGKNGIRPNRLAKKMKKNTVNK